MKTGVINISDAFCSGYRIDPSLHLSEGVSVRAKLHKSPYVLSTVEECSSRIFLGSIFSRCFVKSKEFGVTYLSASDTVLANIETGRYLSKKQANQLKYLMLEKDWILVTCSGTLGNVTYTNNTFIDKIATHDLIRIVPSDEKYKKGCLYAFLSSKYGYYQITQSQFGGVVKHINDKQLGSIIIPKFPDNFQKTVDDLIQESARLREEATDALEEAHSLIESKFDMTLFSNKFGGVSIKEVTGGSMYRFDASYHLSDSAKFEKLILIRNYVTLASLCSDIFGGGRAKRYYTADKSRGVPFLSNSDLGKANPLRTCKYSLRSRGFDESSILKKGMIVTGRVGAIGQTQFIGEEFEKLQVMGSDNVIRIVPKTNSGYIYAYLSSKIGNSMFWKYATGGVQPFISSAMVGQILVPIYEDEIIHRCNDLIELYSSKKEMSNIKENQAILMVEEEIEKWNN